MANGTRYSAWATLHAAAWALKLPTMDKLLLLALTRHVDDYGRAWPSVGTLVRMVGAAESTIVVRLASLEKAALVAVQGFAQRHGSEWQLHHGMGYTPGRGRLKLYRVLPGVNLGGGETEKGPVVGPIPDERVQPSDPNDSAMGPTPGPFSGERVRPEGQKGSGSFGPNSPVNVNSPATPSGVEEVAARPGAISRGAGTPTPITTELVIESIASDDPELAALLRRHTPPPAGAAPRSSEPLPAPPVDPQRR